MTGFDEDSEAREARVAWASVRECHPMLRADGVPLS